MNELIDECRKAYAKKDYSRLDWVCNEILKHDKSNETALTYKAFVYCNWRQYHLVFDMTNRIHALYPDNCHAYCVEASAYLDKKEFEKALECCETALKIKDYSKIKIAKIESLICLDRIDEAYGFYCSSEIPDYDFTEALINCGKYSEISKYGNEDLSADELVGRYLKRCKRLDVYKGSDEILKICGEIFKIDKDNEIALGYKITALQYLDRDDEALKCSNHAIKLYPNNYRFHFYKGETLLWVFDDIDGAIESYGNGLSLVDDFEDHWPIADNMTVALYEKADLLMKSGNYGQAIDVYDKILFYKPNEFKALDNIESISKEHDINYKKSKHFHESSGLRQRARERAKNIDDCLNAIEIGEYDSAYIDGCSKFKDYSSLDEYIRDLIIYLMEDYPKCSEEDARFLVKANMSYVKSSYENKYPVSYCSIEVEYCCG